MRGDGIHSSPWRARGPLQGSSEAWDDVKHVVPATRQNYLRCRHSAEATFELQGENVEDVRANLGLSGGFWEALGAPENCALVYAPASFPQNSAVVYTPWAVAPKEP